LHRGVDALREGRFVEMSATARLGFGLIFGEDEPQGRQVLDLPFLDALGLLAGQRASATRAAFDPVFLGMIGLFGPLERMARMTGLPAGLALTFLAQAFRRGFLKAIA